MLFHRSWLLILPVLSWSTLTSTIAYTKNINEIYFTHEQEAFNESKITYPVNTKKNDGDQNFSTVQWLLIMLTITLLPALILVWAFSQRFHKKKELKKIKRKTLKSPD